MQKKIDVNEVKIRGRKEKIVYALNWYTDTYEERLACVRDLQERGALENLSPTQLNEVSNYLLYSKDVDCEVELKNRAKKQISYEKMVDEGVADMAISTAKNRRVYKKDKFLIDKEKDADIPGMKETWEAMASVKATRDYIDECLKGLRTRDGDNPVEISFVKKHFYKNWYIDLCLNQFALKDIYKPIGYAKYSNIYQWSEDGEELGFDIVVDDYVIYSEGNGRVVDLADPVTIYRLLRDYKIMKENHGNDISSIWKLLYDTLDEAIESGGFSDCLWDILEMKVNGMRNPAVADIVLKEYGVTYNDNYISTLFTKSISKKVARGAVINAKRAQGIMQKRTCPKCNEERWGDEYGASAKKCKFCEGRYKKRELGVRLSREV